MYCFVLFLLTVSPLYLCIGSGLTLRTKLRLSRTSFSFLLKKNKKAAHLFTLLTKQDPLPYLLHSFHPKKAENIQHLQSGSGSTCFLSVTLKRGPHQEIGKKAEKF